MVEIGKRYNRLVILEDMGKGCNLNRMVKVRCDCGTVFVTEYGAVRNGRTQSCGCLRRERVIEANKRRHVLSEKKAEDQG